jgi:hypothetical protein
MKMSFCHLNAGSMGLVVFLALGIDGNRVAHAQESRTSNSPTPQACFFADETTLVRATINQKLSEEASVSWRLAGSNRTISRGRGKSTFDGELWMVEASIPMPSLKPGVIQDLTLEWVIELADGQHKTTQPIYVFSQEAFAHRLAWLKGLDIKLFDPAGSTIDLFDSLGIPYERLSQLAAIDSLNSNILIVGEGVSFVQQRELDETLLNAAERGAMVLCLAPIEGELIIPEQDATPSQLSLGRADFLRTFNKQFDWQRPESSFSFIAVNDRTGLRVDEGHSGWAWLEMTYDLDSGPSRLQVCMWPIVKNWESSPVYRYLFIEILQGLQSKPLPEEVTSNASDQK